MQVGSKGQAQVDAKPAKLGTVVHLYDSHGVLHDCLDRRPIGAAAGIFSIGSAIEL